MRNSICFTPTTLKSVREEASSGWLDAAQFAHLHNLKRMHNKTVLSGETEHRITNCRQMTGHREISVDSGLLPGLVRTYRQRDFFCLHVAAAKAQTFIVTTIFGIDFHSNTCINFCNITLPPMAQRFSKNTSAMGGTSMYVFSNGFLWVIQFSSA